MAKGKRISYKEAYAKAEAITDELTPILEDRFSRDVFLEIIAKEALSRVKGKAKPAENLDSQIRYVAGLLIDEAACSPLDAKLVLRIDALNDAVDQQLSRAFGEDCSERHCEFSLNFASKGSVNMAKLMEVRDRLAARRSSERKPSKNFDLIKAHEEGMRRLAQRDAARRPPSEDTEPPLAKDQTTMAGKSGRETGNNSL